MHGGDLLVEHLIAPLPQILRQHETEGQDTAAGHSPDEATSLDIPPLGGLARSRPRLLPLFHLPRLCRHSYKVVHSDDSSPHFEEKCKRVCSQSHRVALVLRRHLLHFSVVHLPRVPQTSCGPRRCLSLHHDCASSANRDRIAAPKAQQQAPRANQVITK